MHTQTIFELSQEVERLLQLSLQNLNTLKIAPLVLQNDKNISQTSDNPSALPLKFSSAGIDMQVDILKNELRKVTHHEMVLAIVGTMKAGKSTTINAIIGTEVLPNRNRPMTALPTLIRHTPGQHEPILHFPHVLPIKALMGELQKKLSETERQSLGQKLEVDRDMDALLDRIIEGTRFESQYLGAKPIFHCLKSLNDLVRLAAALDVPFPFRSYAVIEHIPFIEVEFVHLAGLNNGQGQLTLLDTPGPNEAGQPHLQEMLNEQLAQASAILAIMDYTQLKSVSDEEVRLAIQSVSKSIPLYILVNKFDQKDRNSDDESQVKAMVAGTLMKGMISGDRIFPVSSMWGYLANRARYELDKRGHLPPADTHSWVQDFAEEALGRRWRNEDLADAEIIRHAASLLWEDSMLGPPIEKILHAAHANAAQYALLSACNKLIDYARDAERYLQFRSQGLQVTNDGLQQKITCLEQDILLLQNMRQELDLTIQQKTTATLAVINNSINHIESQLHDAMNDYFREGLIVGEKQDISSAQQRDFAPGSEKITVESEALARTLLLKIRASGEMLLFTALETITADLNASLSSLEVTLTDSLHKILKPIETRVSDELAEVGLHAQVKLPALQTNQLHSNTHHIFTNVIEYQQVLPPQGGIRDMLARWLSNSEWYTGSEEPTNTIYSIDLILLNQKLHQHITDYLSHIRHIISSQLNRSVAESMSLFITDFSHSLDAIRSNLAQSLVIRQQNETVQLSLKNQLKQFIRTVHYIHEDTRLLRKDLRMFSSAEKP
ncbi:dynamin family protein [Klebsiella sp. BIGb0407]|uniref:dynamin family protein n=1 Tax=Klebsiella sp. BIGb0407 TaxID=2940603 RepID=UPI002166C866|nr:dynamin family protein [Klebsiella sp. BIGb0407]MCS3433839.1 replication fork clamp-binding protein CrfC [Klebsiella sp. BIGb0407]